MRHGYSELCSLQSACCGDEDEDIDMDEDDNTLQKEAERYKLNREHQNRENKSVQVTAEQNKM